MEEMHAYTGAAPGAGCDTAGKVDLKGLSFPEMEEFFNGLGEKKYRAQQVYTWMHRKLVESFEEMTNISKGLRAQLAQVSRISRLELVERSASSDGSVKYLVRLEDGLCVECVYIPEEKRRTLCVSTQVGCAQGCAFCASGRMGLKRHLSAAEIVNQVCLVHRDLAPEPPPSNLVFMGMGEPLHNLEATLKALEILLHPGGLQYSKRRVTVSTVGLVPALELLSKGFVANLAVSINAPDDELRSRLMPVNRRHPLAKLLQVLRRFPLPNRRRITFEYVLLAGVNDSPAQARALARLLRGIPCKINLIAFNETPELPFRRPGPEALQAFYDVLFSAGYNVTLRSSRGTDIAAACGQLAGRHAA